MNNAKTTRKALLTSVVALVICVTMLMGTTFAWFTDTATVAVNTIQSGKLDVDLVDANGVSLVGQPLMFIDQDENTLWEPGCRYALPDVYVKNLGNLAIKYEVFISGVEGDSKLNEVIDWTIDYGYEEGATEGHLAVGDELSKPIKISATMQTTADNDYQNLTMSGISIIVRATQDTVEKDSIDENYDTEAKYASSDENPNNIVILGEQEKSYFVYNEATKTYTIVHYGTTVDYVGATVDVTENFTTSSLVSGSAWNVDPWTLESERSTNFIQNINGREIYQLWINPGNVVTYWFDMDADGITDYTVIFDATNATKTN